MPRDENKKELDDFYKKVSWTFKSILVFNCVLVSMGVVAFALAVIKALGGEIELTVIFGALGTADVVTLFKFSMDRLQRSLGDQVQVVQADKGLEKEMEFIMQLKSTAAANTIEEIEKINNEIRKSTLNSMELIQSFTKIAEPVNPKPWIRQFPVRYGKLELNDSPAEGGFVVTEGKPFKLSGSIRNSSNKDVVVNVIVIAIRPPGGTPDGGPFRFDFYYDSETHKLGPNELFKIKGNTKNIEISLKNEREEIPEEWYRKDWYAFMTCQTEDGCWQDDHNKYWFELKKAKTS